MLGKQPKVSVVIPAYNEATYIDRLLEALAGQDFDNFEVIVSDANSKDGTKEVVESFKKSLNVKFVTAPPRGPAHGRNIGAKKATGEWLLFLDADIVISDPKFITILSRETLDEGLQTSAAKYKVLNPTLSEQIGMGYINYHYLKLLSHTRKPVAPGNCIFTSAKMFARLDGFNESIQFGEDYDYVTRARGGGFGFIESTSYYIDMRRSREEGSFRLFIKGLVNEVYRHMPGYSLEKNPVKYEFGKHKSRDSK